VQNLKKALDKMDCADLAIELGPLLGGLPGQGYLIIGDLPDGSRLSQGHDNGDRTWTLMFDEVAELKFLSGPVRGVTSLKAEIFNFEPGTTQAQRKRRIPLILHTDDGILCNSGQDPSPLPASAQPKVPSVTSGTRVPIPGGTGQDENAPMNSSSSTRSDKSTKDDRVNERRVQMVLASAGGEQLSDHVASPTKVDHSHARTRPEKRWTDELNQLVQAGFAEVRQEAEAALTAAEQRRLDEITELSAAIMKQHDLIASLKRDAEQARQEAAMQLSKAEEQWRHEESERMNAARHDWDQETEALKRDLEEYRSSNEHLEATVAELRAEGESRKRDFENRLREATTEAQQTLSRARAEWQSEVSRCLEAAGVQISAAFERVVPLKPQDR
jgi:hypothetical protein